MGYCNQGGQRLFGDKKMSMKHFMQYYKELERNYYEMIEGLKELEKACSSGMVEPERVDNFMKTMQPIKDSYLAVQYIKYLIDKPNKKQKQKRYEKQFEKVDREHYQTQPEKDRQKLRSIM